MKVSGRLSLIKVGQKHVDNARTEPCSSRGTTMVEFKGRFECWTRPTALGESYRYLRGNRMFLNKILE